MAGFLADVILRLRVELQDQSSLTWLDEDLTRALDRAVNELSRAVPAQEVTTVATSSGSRDISIAGLANMLRVTAVEYPAGQDPRSLVAFSIWGLTLTIVDDPVPDGTGANIYWEAAHTLNAVTNTLTGDLEDLAMCGAAGYACLQQGAKSTPVLNVAGVATPAGWQDLASGWLARFNAEIRRRKTVRRLRLYVGAPPKATQTTDPGP